MLKIVPIFLVVLFTGCTTIPTEVTEPLYKIGADLKEIHEVAGPVLDVAIAQAEKAIEKMEDQEKKAEYTAKLEKMKAVWKKIDSVMEKVDKVLKIIKNYQELATKEEVPELEPPKEVVPTP